jgi:hypothetical protein
MADTMLAPPTFDMQITKIRECAAEHSDDFRMRISRRAENIATFSGARVEHFVMPETWLPMLCGGGQFILAAFHESAPNVIITTVVPGVISGEARAVDIAAPTKAGWQGPSQLLFPKPAPTNGTTSFYDKPGGGGSSAPPRDPTSTAPSSGPSADLIDQRFRLIEAQHAAERADLQRMLDANAKSVERQMQGMTEIIKAIATRPVEPAKPMFDPALLATLTTAATGIVGALIARSGEDRKADLAEQARRDERDSRARDEQIKMIVGMNEQNMKALERNADASSNAMKMVSPMVEAVSLMGRTVVQQIATVQEMAQPNDEGAGWAGFARDAARALAEYLATRPAPAGSPQRQLPPGAAPPPAAPAAGAAPAAPAEEVTPATPEQIAADPPEALAGFLEQAIRAKADPEEVADGYVQMQVNKGFVEMVAAAGGPLKFFQARLGEWVSQNADYVRALVSHLSTRGVKVV